MLDNMRGTKDKKAKSLAIPFQINFDDSFQDETPKGKETANF